MNDLYAEAVLARLTEIRDEIRQLNHLLLTPVPELPCQHPPESRTDSHPSARFWRCNAPQGDGVCGYVYDSEKV